MTKFVMKQDQASHFIETASGNMIMPSMHYHEAYELYYLEMGSREYFLEDKLFSVSAGDFVLIPPGMLHRTGGEYGVRTLVSFTREYLKRMFTPEAIESITRCFEHRKVTPSQNQQALCKNLLKKLADSHDEVEFAMALGLLLTELARCKNEHLKDGNISTIVTFINKNYAQISNISQIAEHFYLSKYHLCRIFKEAMKVTIIEYLNQVRIRNACQMLDFSDKDIGEVAEACGFNSVAYFSNVFKSITGVAPTKYRNENRRGIVQEDLR